MPLQTANWEPNNEMPIGKGATVQQFLATLGNNQFEINVAPWGEGQLKVNGQEVARTAEAARLPGRCWPHVGGRFSARAPDIQIS
jgi:enoyl-[acyl-carrier protein] reductase I